MSDIDDKWVALLRGVNVGGGNRVPMADLRGLAEGLGWRTVRSYIASGNLVFEADAPKAEDLRAAMIRAFDVDVPVMVLATHDMVRADESCRWDVAGNLVHGFFCWGSPVIDQDLLEALRAPDEEVVVEGDLAWLYAPSGVARSKLMAKMEAVLGVSATARNLNTISKLAAMCR